MEQEKVARIKNYEKMNKNFKIIIAGLIGGFNGQGIMGGLFMSPPINDILYDPSIQSSLFLEVTPGRDLFKSIAGMVILSIAHAWFMRTEIKNNIA